MKKNGKKRRKNQKYLTFKLTGTYTSGDRGLAQAEIGDLYKRR